MMTKAMQEAWSDSTSHAVDVELFLQGSQESSGSDRERGEMISLRPEPATLLNNDEHTCEDHAGLKQGRKEDEEGTSMATVGKVRCEHTPQVERIGLMPEEV